MLELFVFIGCTMILAIALRMKAQRLRPPLHFPRGDRDCNEGEACLSKFLLLSLYVSGLSDVHDTYHDAIIHDGQQLVHTLSAMANIASIFNVLVKVHLPPGSRPEPLV